MQEAKMSRSNKDLNQAVSYYETAIQIYPNLTKAYKEKGSVLYELKRYEEAIKSYDSCIKLEPSEVEFFFVKAAILTKMEKHNETIEAFNTAIKLNPVHTLGYYLKGITPININIYMCKIFNILNFKVLL